MICTGSGKGYFSSRSCTAVSSNSILFVFPICPENRVWFRFIYWKTAAYVTFRPLIKSCIFNVSTSKLNKVINIIINMLNYTSQQLKIQHFILFPPALTLGATALRSAAVGLIELICSQIRSIIILTVIKYDAPFQDYIPSVPQSLASAALISAKTIFFSAVLQRIPVSGRHVSDSVL